MSFNQFDIPQSLLQALERMKYVQPTPVQAQAIPLGLQGADLIASAQTGTGKTAAFGIPLINLLLREPNAQALVLAPTRELADQIVVVLKQLSADCQRFGICLLIGGVSMRQQDQVLHRRPRIIVATPGRLVDHLNKQPKLLIQTRFLVLDEADRMLDLGFAPQLRVIREALPEKRQTLLFSATFPTDIAQLAKEWLRDPQRVAIGSVSKPVSQIEQSMIEVNGDQKNNRLVEELKKREGSVLVFARTKRRTDRLAMFLKDKGVAVSRIHGDRSQHQREDALRGFKNGKFRVLVATDIAARGIDVPHIEHVINYDLPYVADDYLHRIGRTGRAGRTGQALCFVSPEERGLWKAIQRLLGTQDGMASRDKEKPSFRGSRQGRSSSQRRGGGSRHRHRRGRGFGKRESHSGQARVGSFS